MLPGPFADEFGEDLPQRHVAERHRAQTVEDIAVDALQMVDDGGEIAGPRRKP